MTIDEYSILNCLSSQPCCVPYTTLSFRVISKLKISAETAPGASARKQRRRSSVDMEFLYLLCMIVLLDGNGMPWNYCAVYQKLIL